MKDPLAVANAIIWSLGAALIAGLLLVQHLYYHY